MDDKSLSSAITRIELLWSTMLREKSGDPRSYDYIATQAATLKKAVTSLQIDVGNAIHNDKQEKLKYQKLHASLATILSILDYQSTPCKDEKYILSILEKMREIRKEIEALLEYQ